MSRRTDLLVEWGYRLSLFAKAVLGLSQLAGGVLLWFLPAGSIPRMAAWLTRSELSQDPADPIALAVARWASGLGTQAEQFYSIYLVSHGALNFGVVLGLLLRIRGAYHVSLAILMIFVVYQTISYFKSHDPALILLTAIDLLVIILVLLERRRSGSETG